MTDDQARIMEALGRGRLIFPFREELADLRGRQGPRTSEEGERLKALEDAHRAIKTKDQWFHSAMKSGDIEAAAKVAQEVAGVLEDLA